MLGVRNGVREAATRHVLLRNYPRSRRRGRRQILVMQATRQRSGAHPEWLADLMWVSGVADGATRPVRSAIDRTTIRADTITPQLGEGPATGSVRPGSTFLRSTGACSRSRSPPDYEFATVSRGSTPGRSPTPPSRRSRRLPPLSKSSADTRAARARPRCAAAARPMPRRSGSSRSPPAMLRS